MDPAKNDMWWKTRIEKEQAAFYGERPGSSARGPAAAASGGTTVHTGQAHRPPSSVTTSTKAWKQRNQNWETGGRGQQQAKTQGPSSSSSRQAAGAQVSRSARQRPQEDYEQRWEVGSQGPSPSVISYPATPNFSEAGSKVGTEIMNRLSQLERDIMEERRRREVAEREMKGLLEMAKAANVPWPS